MTPDAYYLLVFTGTASIALLAVPGHITRTQRRRRTNRTIRKHRGGYRTTDQETDRIIRAINE